MRSSRSRLSRWDRRGRSSKRSIRSSRSRWSKRDRRGGVIREP